MVYSPASHREMAARGRENPGWRPSARGASLDAGCASACKCPGGGGLFPALGCAGCFSRPCLLNGVRLQIARSTRQAMYLSVGVGACRCGLYEVLVGAKPFRAVCYFSFTWFCLGKTVVRAAVPLYVGVFAVFCVGCVLMVFPNDGTTFSVPGLLSRWRSAVAAAPQNNVISSAAESRTFHSFASAVHWWLCLMI